MKIPSLDHSHLKLSSPVVIDEAVLTYIESDRHIFFPIKRVYTITSVDFHAVRGHHAHHKTQQALFCIQGSVTINFDNGFEKTQIFLNRPEDGVRIDPMVWHEMTGFSRDAALMVLADDFYNEADYIRSYDSFTQLVKEIYDPHE